MFVRAYPRCSEPASLAESEVGEYALRTRAAPGDLDWQVRKWECSEVYAAPTALRDFLQGSVRVADDRMRVDRAGVSIVARIGLRGATAHAPDQVENALLSGP